ncbi:MAG: pseudouridine synthase [Bifidobacterium tibiigranuli]|jgi:tRNA pseudouridine32 synthase/23S rRNA pseudouridine746 synthase|uniref:pseudouridine synthase n=1 Tax=Bifidobacterium tibiigranuli TaxID=2172043 RepID=UPI0023556890|nr:pseudouridine synthase [Bifidobacterium tibiigranuli]MCH3973981.1 pseudouridine synthase [Bifidobacterium tibiigranuli]MCH4189805.1 pseudouridine synthase [Bifidobacterium tibiigranuli]MCH4203971.1 pseudouridine synthase [Bifidobacterium tibiigranuli]MCH4274522.1 pseudouridine synthase [Bifidobacterium tibiigranuli]MCI1790851.1 pseudouridine synthase [Bifidobacterium tibiigranuli]
MVQGHRWVGDEPEISFEYDIVYEDSGIIVIDKPHFLATTPRGMWYRQTALIRLREQFGEPDITPAHRLDRSTAGIVVFTRKPRLRKTYQMLFQKHMVTKTYECLAPCVPIARPRFGTITRLDPPAVFPLLRRSRIVKRRGILQAYEEPGEMNAETVIRLGDVDADVDAGVAAGTPRAWPMRYRRYVLEPRTGKTHQLRVHMNALDLPIAGDELYPSIQNRAYDDFSQPLQLVARSLEFIDPITDEPRRFVSRVELGWG